jgi:hypothetical protein
MTSLDNIHYLYKKSIMQPDYQYLISRIDLITPLIGIYDAPDQEPFEPVVTIPQRQRACIFEFYNDWVEGKTLKITPESYGCGGCGTWMFGIHTRSREDYIKFLAGKEGLKASEELMGKWFDQVHRYRPVHGQLFLGPLKAGQYEYLKTVTFYANPDQLSVLVLAANYHAGPDDPAPVSVDFGSGCMEMLTLVHEKPHPFAVIGATDMAMRNNLPPDKMAFTVNKAMFERVCSIGSDSFLEKPFLKMLKYARGGKLAQ